MPRELKPGLYDEALTEELAECLDAAEKAGLLHETEPLDAADSDLAISRALLRQIGSALRAVSAEKRPGVQIEIANSLLNALSLSVGGADHFRPPGERLLSVFAQAESPIRRRRLPRPSIPLSQSDLLVNARGEPGVGSALLQEIPSADSIDLLCAFIKWNGFRILEPAIRSFLEGGGSLRVITTTYLGATERRAIDRLRELGAEVRVTYETKNTRLHAKAWLFHRKTGYSTAYIGSSNLSRSALLDGLEWNVRLSQVETPAIVQKFEGVFESYWASPDFEEYDTGRDATRFDTAISSAYPSGAEILPLSIDINPYPFQTEILERIETERVRHNRHRNLIVAATGTGKTIIAALDFKRLRRTLGNPSLLYVAHRKEILTQGLQAFRTVLRDGVFGELYVDGSRPEEGRHIFASVQSLAQVPLGQLSPRAFDVVIIDEFHHAAAPTYERLLNHFEPVELIGLTATPERADGRSVLDWFGGRIAAELRLWEALERGLLCPFQYFGVADGTDLSGVAWTRGGYQDSALENLYTANDARVRLVLQSIHVKVAAPNKMRSLGFCVSIAHAEFMARKFNDFGIPSLSLSGNSRAEERDQALHRLKTGDVKVIFTVDLFNEGIDLPEIDTVLFLRPTESSTVFLQQLGRGLRRSEDKDCLTVLDFIGQAHRRFRFDLKYRSLTGSSRPELERDLEAGFPHLPAGCTIQLDRVASKIVLENVRRALGAATLPLVEELRAVGDISIQDFLKHSGLELTELYRNGRYWTGLRRQAGFLASFESPDEAKLGKGLGRLLRLDDQERGSFFRDFFSTDTPRPVQQLDEYRRRMLIGLHFDLWGEAAAHLSLDDALARIWSDSFIRAELLELFDLLEAGASHVTVPLNSELGWSHPVPLSVHGTYSLSEISAAFGKLSLDHPDRIREGVFFDETSKSDVFFVTLEKSESRYSPSTRYRDYAISRELFHWQSQNTTSEGSPTGQRLIHHRDRGSNIFLCVRRTPMDDRRTSPYVFLGPADYVSHSGERPISFVWRLRRPAPIDFFEEFQLAAG
jgi:superfamily II DNA or RNA helicase/HKD family nuclease